MLTVFRRSVTLFVVANVYGPSKSRLAGSLLTAISLCLAHGSGAVMRLRVYSALGIWI
mgnify:CR=1 FL=1